MTNTRMSRNPNIALFGDFDGIQQLLQALPAENIKCLIAATNRPQYHDEIMEIAKKSNHTFLIQPALNSSYYGLFLEKFLSFNIDFIFCKSYSMILRSDLLSSVNYNAINFHASLLPANRGPNPVNWAIIKGETKTGITLHYMDDGLDSGDIIAQKEIEISFDDTWVTLLNKIKRDQIKFMKEKFSAILVGENSRTPQPKNIFEKNKRLDPNYPKIEFNSMDDLQIYNLIRAQVHPLPGAYLLKDEKRTYYNTYLSYEEVKKLRYLNA